MRSNQRQSPSGATFIEQARRRQIIEALIADVSESGYAASSIGKVASRAKISKSVVLYHFAGKDELIETTVHQIYAEIWNVVRPRMEAETTARGRLRAYIESEFLFLEQHRDRLLALSYLLVNHRNSEGAFYLREEAEKTNLQTLGAMLEQGQKNGEFRSFAIRPMAATLMHAINGALSQWATDPSLPLSEYAGEIAVIFDLATRKQTNLR